MVDWTGEVVISCPVPVLISRSASAFAGRRPGLPRLLDDLVPSAWHHVERHANNPIETVHSQLKHRLRPKRGLRTDRTAQAIIAGHAFVQSLRRGHYELGIDSQPKLRVASAFRELARVI